MKAKELLCDAIRTMNVIAANGNAKRFYVLEYNEENFSKKSIFIEIVSSDIGYTEATTGEPIKDLERQRLIRKFSSKRFKFGYSVGIKEELNQDKAYELALKSFIISQASKLPHIQPNL